MKNVDEFARTNLSLNDSLNAQIDYYKRIDKKIKNCLSRKEAYERLLREDNNDENESSLSFKEKWELYNIVNNLIRTSTSNGNYTYLDIDLLSLRKRLETVFEDVYEYARIKYELRSLNEEKESVLKECITFYNFYNDSLHKGCVDRHILVRLDDELKCMRCGATTKDYAISEEELDFLTLCADSQGLLVKEATKDDLPLLQVLIEKDDYYKSLRRPLESFEEDEDYLTEAEEQWLEDEALIPDLNIKIKKAHALDSQTYDDSSFIRISNPKYLSNKKSKKLLSAIKTELNRIQEIDSRFKDLMIEECLTAKYEVLILSGENIPTLVEQTQSEEEKVALTKAYYNISNQQFRSNSDYFDWRHSDWEAYAYDCVTANPEINNRILQMKLRR